MNIISFEEIPSTNLWCRQNISLLRHGDVVMSRRQSAGRGRKQRVWSSEDGGLYFSLILKEGLSGLKAPGVLTQLMALSVCKAVNALGAKSYIKWPNDVLSQGKKFCGILSEAVFNGIRLEGVIIGAGINLSQKIIKSDKPFITLAELGINVQPQTLLEQVCSNFEEYYSLLQKDGFTALRGEYKKAFGYLGRQVTLHIFEDTFTGTAQDIDCEGRLILNTDKGLKTVNIGDMDF